MTPSGDDTARRQQRFFRALERVGPLSRRARKAFEPLLVSRSFVAGQSLLRGGQMASHAFFVDAGLVREFYLGPDGREHTRTFVRENELTGSLLDLLSKRPAVTFIQALEPTSTLAFPSAEFELLCERYPELQRCARRFSEELYVRKAKREHDMLARSAAERHADWLRDHPELDARVRRQHLASYLGITPEHLSRLRRRALR